MSVCAPAANADGLENYVGSGVRAGLHEHREVDSAFVAGSFIDWGLSSNALARFGADRTRGAWILSADALYIFAETSPYVRPFVGAGANKDPDRGPWQPDVRLGLALLGFGAGNLQVEAAWRGESAELAAGFMGPL